MPKDLHDLLRRQYGIATREQLVACGVSRRTVDAHCAARRWRPLNERVIATHNGPLLRAQQVWAVVLSAAGPVAVCGLTVLELLGVRGFPADTIHVLVPKSSKPLPVAGVPIVVHESRRFSEADVVRVRGVPATTLARAFIDAAAWSTDARTAHRIVVAAVQQRRLLPTDMLVELDRAGQLRYRRVLRQLLHDMQGGAQALSEVEFLRFCRRHGFPKPQLQHRDDVAGRRRYLDACFTGTNGKYFLVEVDGGVHLDVRTRWNDTRKDNDSGLAGRLVLRFPSIAIYTDDPDAVRQIQLALELVRR